MVDDIKAGYRNAEIGNIYDGKHRVTSVGSGTLEYIVELLERLTAHKKTQLVYLILEETDG